MDSRLLALLVLDSLADDHETLATMRNQGEQVPYGLALVDEQDVIHALAVLLDDGLVEALEEQPDHEGLAVMSVPRRDPQSLRRYWFRPTERGWQVWRDGWGVLDACYADDPSGPSSQRPSGMLRGTIVGLVVYLAVTIPALVLIIEGSVAGPALMLLGLGWLWLSIRHLQRRGADQSSPADSQR